MLSFVPLKWEEIHLSPQNKLRHLRGRCIEGMGTKGLSAARLVVDRRNGQGIYSPGLNVGFLRNGLPASHSGSR